MYSNTVLKLNTRVNVIEVDADKLCLYRGPTDSRLFFEGLSVKLINALKDGATRDELLCFLSGAGDSGRKLDSFILKLEDFGFLNTSKKSSSNNPIYVFPNPDSISRNIAGVFRIMPGRLVLFLALVLVFFSSWYCLDKVSLSYYSSESLVERFSYWAILLIFFVWIPIHEMGHAITASYFGVKINQAGVLIANGYFPNFKFFISTQESIKLKDPLKQSLISLAGPITDCFLFASTLFVASVYSGSVLGDVFYTLSVFAILIVLVNLNPFSNTDGAAFFKNILNENNLLTKSLSLGYFKGKGGKAVFLYRIYCVVFLVVVVNLAVIGFDLTEEIVQIYMPKPNVTL